MVKELIIHLGDTKTGSTSIQKALAGNICNIPGKTLFYPTRTHHVSLAKTLEEDRFFAERAERFGKIHKALQKSDADYGIVSAEYFQFVDPGVLQQALDMYWPDLADRVRLVAYVRPHAGKFLSAFAERLKLGIVSGTLETFFEAPSTLEFLTYAPRFQRWRAIFGDRFELRPFIRDSLYRGDAVQDFLRFVARGQAVELAGEAAANKSLSLGQLALLRDVHKVVRRRFKGTKTQRFRDTRNNLGRLVAEHLQARKLGEGSGRLMMPTALAERFVERFAADAAALDAEFFAGHANGTPMSDALQQSLEKSTDTPQSLKSQDYFNADVIRSVKVFSAVLTDLMAEDPDHFRQMIGKIRARAWGAG